MVASEAVTAAVRPERTRAALGLSRERMARLLDVSSKSVERWETQGTLPTSRATRRLLSRLAEIVDLGLIVYTPEGFRVFMTLPMPVFHDGTALQAIEAGEADLVFAALAGDYEGGIGS